MPHYLGIPQISLPETETLGPWGNSPSFFCKLFHNYSNVQELERVFREYMIDLIHHQDKEKLLLTHNLLKILGLNKWDSHYDSDISELEKQIEEIVYKLENDGVYQDWFMERVTAKIVQEVSSEESEWFYKIKGDLESGNTNVSGVVDKILNMEIKPKE